MMDRESAPDGPRARGAARPTPSPTDRRHRSDPSPAPRDAAAAVAPAATTVLRLQVGAGNAAVSQLLAPAPRRDAGAAPPGAALVQRQSPPRPASGTPAAASSAPAAAEPSLQSPDPEVNGRPVSAVGADLQGRTTRYRNGVESFKRNTLESKQSEVEWYGELDLLGRFIDLFNSAPRTDPARWDPIPAQWDAVRDQLDGALRIPVTPQGIAEAGLRSQEAIDHFHRVYQLEQATREQFARYLQGFTHSAETVHTVAVVVRDISFAAAVSVAVVVAAPAVLAGAGAAATAAGLSGTTATIATVGGTALTMGALGSGIEGGAQGLAAFSVEGIQLLRDLTVEGQTWSQAAGQFDWNSVGLNTWQGMKRGFVDGVLAYAGMGFDRVLARGTTVALTRVLGQAGASTLAQILRTALTRAITGGASGSVLGALDAGIKAATEGKTLAEVEAAMAEGFRIGALAGAVLGGGGGAFEGRTRVRLTAEISELQSLLVSNPTEFARRYAVLVEGLTPAQRAAWDVEMQGRRFVDRAHYEPAADAFTSGASTVPPQHRYGEGPFRDWQEAAAALDAHARTGQPLTQAEVEGAHQAAARRLTPTAGQVRGAGGDELMAGGGRGAMGLWSALSPEQVAILERNPHIRLENRGMANASLTAEEVARRYESAIIVYPDGATVQQELDRFFQRYVQAARTMDPVELAAHAQRDLVSIHPFNDGNGRVSRLVMDHALQQRGLPPALLDNPNLDYLVAEAAWVAEVRRGVVEAYQTTLRHVDVFNAALRAGDFSRAATVWGSILGLTGQPDVLISWLYHDDPVCR